MSIRLNASAVKAKAASGCFYQLPRVNLKSEVDRS